MCTTCSNSSFFVRKESLKLELVYYSYQTLNISHHMLATIFAPCQCICHMLQVFLLLLAFAAVPWMLIPKPYILKKRHEARMAQVTLHSCLALPDACVVSECLAVTLYSLKGLALRSSEWSWLLGLIGGPSHQDTPVSHNDCECRQGCSSSLSCCDGSKVNLLHA